jgi:hypothetical protein
VSQDVLIAEAHQTAFGANWWYHVAVRGEFLAGTTEAARAILLAPDAAHRPGGDA